MCNSFVAVSVPERASGYYHQPELVAGKGSGSHGIGPSTSAVQHRSGAPGGRALPRLTLG